MHADALEKRSFKPKSVGTITGGQRSRHPDLPRLHTTPRYLTYQNSRGLLQSATNLEDGLAVSRRVASDNWKHDALYQSPPYRLRSFAKVESLGLVTTDTLSHSESRCMKTGWTGRCGETHLARTSLSSTTHLRSNRRCPMVSILRSSFFNISTDVLPSSFDRCRMMQHF